MAYVRVIGRENERQLARDFIGLFPGHTFNAITVMQGMRERWGILIDWHEASAALDYLSREGVVQFVGHKHDGMCEYVVNTKE